MRWLQKKATQSYTAHRAALGGRTLKTGQSRCFVGYKKHTLRLWWREHTSAVLLVPLVSWVAPANVSEGGFLVPSLRYCERHWSWWPQIVVADMGYLAAEAKAICRKAWRVAVVTKLKSNMNLVPPYVAWNRTTLASIGTVENEVSSTWKPWIESIAFHVRPVSSSVATHLLKA